MSYFLKKTKNKKGLYLQIYSGALSKERGHVVQSCYRSLGYYDDLVASGIDDPIACVVSSKNGEKFHSISRKVSKFRFVA